MSERDVRVAVLLGACLWLASGCTGEATGDGVTDRGGEHERDAGPAAAGPSTDPDAAVPATDAGGAGAPDAAERDSGAGGEPAPGPECDGWQSAHPAWLWCDDFEDGRRLRDKYQDVSENGMSVVDDVAFGGGHSLRQTYEVGQVNAGWIAWQYADAPFSNGVPAEPVVYVRWYHRFQEGFEGMPPKMARIRRLRSDWSRQYAIHHWIASASASYAVVADVHAADSSQANSAGWLPAVRTDFHYAEPANIGRWVCHEMMVRINTPGGTDGEYRFWADGALIAERTGVDIRGPSSGHLNEVMLDTYWNGGSPARQHRWYDNFVISTERIGCLD